MERVSGKKRKLGIPTSKVIIFATIAILITFGITLLGRVDDGVIVQNIDFEDIQGNDKYVTFDLHNPTNTKISCDLDLLVGNQSYADKALVNPTTVKPMKIRVFMPYGRTDVSVKYDCSSLG